MSRFLIIHCTMSEPGTTGTCVNHSHVLKHSALRCKWEGERRPGDLARPPSSSHPSAMWADNRPSISKSAFMTLSVGEQTGAERRGGSCCRCSRCSFHMLPDTASLLLWSQLVCSSVCLNDSLLSAASSPPGRFHTTTHGTSAKYMFLSCGCCQRHWQVEVFSSFEPRSIKKVWNWDVRGFIQSFLLTVCLTNFCVLSSVSFSPRCLAFRHLCIPDEIFRGLKSLAQPAFTPSKLTYFGGDGLGEAWR